MNFESKYIKAPEIYGTYWLNSEPVSIQMHGFLGVLVHFWDYTDMNSIRTFPYIDNWCEKYKDFGLLVIGVHSPEFDFAKSIENVEQATKHFNISYPVVIDNDALVKNAYGVRSLPTRFLIDREGFIRFIHYGEGNYIEFERAIQQLLSESGFRGELPLLSLPLRKEDTTGVVCYPQTGKLYFGYLKGALGNPEGYNPESTIDYQDPGIYMQEKFYLKGKWKNQRQCLSYEGFKGEEGMVIIPYRGCDVNAVMGSSNGVSCEVEVYQDDRPVSKEVAGIDCIRRDQNSTVIIVTNYRIYNIISCNSFGEHLLRLSTFDNNLEIYTVSFTTSVIPEFAPTNELFL